jgi:Eco57I restriction-modification methylase
VLAIPLDPKRVGGQLFTIEFEKVRPLLEQALRNEQEHEETVELAVAAQGLLQATRLLADDFTLVATNVPYLEQRKQTPALREYCARNHPSAKGDLATAFVERIKRSTAKRGTLAVVTPQNWLFLTTYKHLRETLLKDAQWRLLALLGPQAFETISGHVVKPILLILENDKAGDATEIRQLDVSGETTPAAKSLGLIGAETLVANQLGMLRNPDARVTFGIDQTTPKLQHYCSCLAGIMNGDSPHYQRLFWEVTAAQSEWVFQQTTVSHTIPYGGLEKLIYFDEDNGHLRADAEFRRAQLHNSDERGNEAWGRKGIAVSQTGNLPISMYLGNKFDSNVAAVVPHNTDDLPALWAYLSSPDFSKQVRKLDPKLNVTNATIGQVPFDRALWAAAAKRLPHFPAPCSTDPTQWIFTGQPRESDSPLQVGVARLLGYRWPRQTGSSFLDCPALKPDGLEKHADANGVVPLNAIAGATSAGHRLRELLADAYGGEWSASKLQELLGNWDSLEDWLRDGFFEEHCRIFCQRPVIWHVWDGRKDGFHALVNYHVMAAPNGEGRQTLEKLIYTYLGRWIERQTDEVRAGKEGADARLTAATQLKTELENILRGEKPYDIFVRWKPLHEQPIGWDPDINDGVRLNIRPWLTAKVYQPSRRDSCVLRVTPRIPFGKDRGNEPPRLKDDSPWFWTWDGHSDDFIGGVQFDGARWNDPHYSLVKKKEARERHK